MKEAPKPINVTELKYFLDLINYYHKFIPNLPSLLSPLYKLLKKNSKWNWMQEQESAFTRAKELLQSFSLLIHYDPTKQILIAADAFPYGLGAVLSHRMDDSEKPIMFASRTLTVAEQKYYKIEKEALAKIFAGKKFHQFLHVKSFKIHSDHKPLQYLFSEKRQVPVMAYPALVFAAGHVSLHTNIQTWIHHSPCRCNDALSILPSPKIPESTSLPAELNHLISQLSSNIVTAEQIKQWTD